MGAIVIAAGILLPGSEALALDDGKLTLFVDESVTWDDNVFRIPKGTNPNPSGEALPRGDTYYTTSAGISFDLPVSRQRFQGNYTWNDSRYQRYTNLDFTGHNAKILWLWQVGNDASGQLGYTDVAAPQSFANVQGRVTDVLHTKQAFVNGAVLVTPRWRLEGGANGFEQTNSDSISRLDNLNFTSGEATLSYVSPANNALGVHFRIEDGHYPNREFVPGGVFPHAYRQYDTGAVFDWTITGKSRLRGRLEYANRRWDQFPQLDWDGMVGRLQYDWQPTGKLSLATIARREINPYDDMKSSFTLIKGVTLIPTWNATAKIDVTAALDYSVRDYLGVAQFACGIAPGGSDRVKSGTLAVSWRPTRTVTLQLSAQRQNCSSDVPLANYVANIFALGIRIGL